MFHKFCDRCGKKFMPTGKRGRLCEDCRRKAHLESFERRYGRKSKAVKD